jgi:hypothetical protein
MLRVGQYILGSGVLLAVIGWIGHLDVHHPMWVMAGGLMVGGIVFFSIGGYRGEKW